MTSPNPLVATAAPAAVDPWAGVWIAEDLELIARGVEDGSWIDVGLGGVSAGLDGLALVSDPIGGLLQYGVAWIIEHVKPLTEALDWLAGDPAQIAAQAQTYILEIGRDGSGRIIFLEKGNSRAGMRHILERHARDFTNVGIPEDKIGGLVFEAVTTGQVVGTEGRRSPRNIYEVVFEGRTYRLAVTVGNNGFIVGANPVGR